jgi:PTS system cellobiose-specific IIA component
MLVQEANGNHIPVNVMLVHAQDHLMTSMLAQELIAEIIDLYRTR